MDESESKHESDYSLIPSAVRKVYRKLEEEVIWTHDRWNGFQLLFNKNADRIDLMKTLAPQFFGDLRGIWADDVILHVCRLTDEPSERSHERLSLAQLHKGKVLREHAEKEFIRQLKRLWRDAQRQAEPLRNYRNLRIAHLDKPMTLGEIPSAGVSIEQVEDALVPIRQYMRLFRLKFMGDEMHFGHVFRYDNADTLIHLLKCAYAYQELEQEEIPKGSWECLRRIQEGKFRNA